MMAKPFCGEGVPNTVRGERGLSLVEMLIGVVAVALITVAVVFFVLSNRAKRQTTDCATNLKQVGVALQLYASDYDGIYPPAQATLISTETQKPMIAPWSLLLTPYVRGTFPACPARFVPVDQQSDADKPRNSGYGYNLNLSNAGMPGNTGGAQSVISNPTLLVAAFDSRVDHLALGTPDSDTQVESAPGAIRHQKSANYVFADGHVRAYKPDELRTDKKCDGVHPGFGL